MKQSTSFFIYPQWAKVLGAFFLLFALGGFFYRISQYDVFDLAGASFPFAMGLMLIFFSREKMVDERIAYLKFKALATAIPIAGLITMLINYRFNYAGYSIQTDSWFSISAFEFLSIALLLAIGNFYWLQHKE